MDLLKNPSALDSSISQILSTLPSNDTATLMARSLMLSSPLLNQSSDPGGTSPGDTGAVSWGDRNNDW